MYYREVTSKNNWCNFNNRILFFNRIYREKYYILFIYSDSPLQVTAHAPYILLHCGEGKSLRPRYLSVSNDFAFKHVCFREHRSMQPHKHKHSAEK